MSENMVSFVSGLRDRWLSQLKVRLALSRLPIGRVIADAHAKRLFGLVAGFAQSQMLAAAIDLGLIAALAAEPVSAADLAERFSIDGRGAAALVQALVATGIVERRGETIALTIDGWVVATDAGLRAMIAHNALLYRDLADPVALLRAPGSGALGAFWPYQGAGDADGYSALMAISLPMVSDIVRQSVDLARFRHIMDVGGGEGAFLGTIASDTNARFTLADLPAVVERARRRLEASGLAARTRFAAIDDTIPLPRGADAVTLIRVMHDRDDDAARALLARVADALAPGATLIVAEPCARTGIDAQTAYFAAYFAAMGSGRLRSRTELEQLIASAGFRLRRGGASSLLADVIIARRR